MYNYIIYSGVEYFRGMEWWILFMREKDILKIWWILSLVETILVDLPNCLMCYSFS